MSTPLYQNGHSSTGKDREPSYLEEEQDAPRPATITTQPKASA
jgi:hypothetical protein